VFQQVPAAVDCSCKDRGKGVKLGDRVVGRRFRIPYPRPRLGQPLPCDRSLTGNPAPPLSTWRFRSWAGDGYVSTRRLWVSSPPDTPR
jgi:hypothetical protein